MKYDVYVNNLWLHLVNFSNKNDLDIPTSLKKFFFHFNILLYFVFQSLITEFQINIFWAKTKQSKSREIQMRNTNE